MGLCFGVLSDSTHGNTYRDVFEYSMQEREMMNDSLLTCYDIVIVDETHERTLRTDIVLASLKCILASNAMRWGRSGSSYTA